MKGPPLGPSGEDITWPDQVACRGRKASSTRKIKPQTSNLLVANICSIPRNKACKTRHMRSLFPASKRHLLYHTKRGHMLSPLCTSATAF